MPKAAGDVRELLHAAVRLDAARHVVEELRHAPAHDFGVARGDERRRVHEVDEEDRCEFALHGSKCRNAARGSVLPLLRAATPQLASF